MYKDRNNFRIFSLK